ncbi:MAG: polyphosphate kinase 2 family protein, partial [Vicinamibacterales bacterium]
MGKDTLARLGLDFAITDGKGFRLDDVDPNGTRGFSGSKEESDELLEEAIARIAERQETLYAQNQWGLLLIFQAMDAAGKDSA